MDDIAMQDLLCHIRESGYTGSDAEFDAAIRKLHFESNVRNIQLQQSTSPGFNALLARFCALGHKHFHDAGSHVVGFGLWHVAFAGRKAGKKSHQVKSVVLRSRTDRSVRLSVEYFNGKARYGEIPASELPALAASLTKRGD